MTTPFSAQDEARKADDICNGYQHPNIGPCLKCLTKALSLAFQRGREVEREECAKLAYSLEMPHSGTSFVNISTPITTAIRTRIVEEK